MRMMIQSCFKQWSHILIVVLGPILLLPILFIFENDASKCGYVVLLLLLFWISEAIPVPVTSLLPLVLFPLSGLLKANEVASNYFKDTSAFFFGSITLAYAIQRVNLHRRVALLILTLVGSSAKWTMAGLMLTTCLLSMWMNNAACTSIMLPIALAIAAEYEQHANSGSTISAITNVPGLVEISSETVEQGERISTDKTIKLRKGLILCVACGSIYGGLTTLVGSAATIFLKGYIDEQYPNTNFHLNFLNYLLLALPTVVLMMGSCWLWLQFRYNYNGLMQWRCRKVQSLNEREEHLRESLRQQYKELGSLRWNELIVGGLFFSAVILWITRDLGGGSTGWSRLFSRNSVSNGTIALLIAILTMILPNEKPALKDWKYNPILSWSDLSRNYPWGTLTLVGAGLSIAQAFQVSKLSDLLGNALHFVHQSSYLVILVTIIILSEVCTQFINNLSIASILFPVISTLVCSLIESFDRDFFQMREKIATNTGIHPARLFLPSTLSLSLAFLLPISSQPNSLIFATGHINTSDMLTNGLMLNILGGLIICLASMTWMVPIFNLDQPFISSNLTSTNVTFFP